MKFVHIILTENYFLLSVSFNLKAVNFTSSKVAEKYLLTNLMKEEETEGQ